MIALGTRSRAAVVAAALAAFGTAIALTVNGGAGEDRHDLPERPVSAPLPLATPFVTVAARRDPFAGGEPAAPAATPAALPPLPPIPAVPGTIGALPPNRGAGATGAARVTAILTGAHPSALLDDGTAVRLVAPGDAVRGDRVTSIDDAGVHLSRGDTLRVMPAVPLPSLTPGGRP